MEESQLLVILFGRVGSGKNYVGRILAQRFGCRFYDADEDLPPATRAAIENREPFTNQMRAEYVDIVVERIRVLAAARPRLVISQALFRNRNRRQILNHFPHARFIWVQADDNAITARLKQRRDHVAGSDCAHVVKPGFELPDVNHDVIVNDASESHVVEQARVIFGKYETPTSGFTATPARA